VLAPVVVKVGGSLYDWPDLGKRLHSWLCDWRGGDVNPPREGNNTVLLVPGGGPLADVLRSFDQQHRLGEETSHWLALQALTLNARFLAALLPAAEVVGELRACPGHWQKEQVPILDAYRFAVEDEGCPGCLPHTWEVSSDSLAARVAVVLGASRLVLLKSVTIPGGICWEEAGRQGFVDRYFADVLNGTNGPGLEVEAINLRQWPA